MIFKLLISLSLLMSTICSFALDRPSWTIQHPVDSEYFIGIGYSIIKDNPDYQNQAKSSAFHEIATQIEVNVKSESENNLTEDSGNVKDISRIKTYIFTDIKIENIELFDSWKDKKEYWVYYRLSKSEYKRLRKEKLDSAMNISLSYYEQGIDCFKKGLIVNAIQNLQFALTVLSPYVGESLSIKKDDINLQLYQNIVKSINDIQNNLSLEFSQYSVNCKKGNTLNQKVPLYVFMKSNKKKIPVTGIPVSFRLINRSGKIFEFGVTDSSGKIDFKIDKIFLNSQDDTIEAYINTDSLFALYVNKEQNRDTYIFKPAKTSLQLHCQPIVIKLIENHTDSQNNRIHKNQLSPYVEKYLLGIGVNTVMNGECDFIININCTFRKGKQISAMNAFTSLIDIDLTMTDLSNKKESWHEILINQKGVATTEEDAQNRAVQNLGNLLQTKILPQKFESLFYQ